VIVEIVPQKKRKKKLTRKREKEFTIIETIEK
jgi:hypothetical protein